eukprot:13966158-Alexandrium_andersonii.AAC.1
MARDRAEPRGRRPPRRMGGLEHESGRLPLPGTGRARARAYALRVGMLRSMRRGSLEDAPRERAANANPNA